MTTADAHHENPEFVYPKLWKDDVIVVGDWLTSVDFDSLPATKAQKQALFDLLARLEEWSLYATPEELDVATQAVARDIGW